MNRGIDSWGRPIVPDQRPAVSANSDLDDIRNAIITVMREKRAVIQNGGNHVTLAVIKPDMSGEHLRTIGSAFMAAVWSLVRDGIIVPGEASTIAQPENFSNDHYRHFPYFTLTPQGAALLARSDTDPVDKSAFLTDARQRLGNADERIFTYLSEANDDFLHANYLSAAVMLGVSAELLMKWLIERFIDHVGTKKRPDFEKTRDELRMRTDRLFDTFIKAFAEHYAEFPRELEFQSSANLDLLQTLIRINRDDVGHGRPDRVDRQMIHGYLISYLTLLKVAREMADAFANNSCTKYPSV